MATEHHTTCSIIIGGLECEVCVVFEVESYGDGGSYFEPPEPPSIVINDVRMGDEDGRSVYDLCEQTRDIWAKPRYASGIWQINSGGPRLHSWEDRTVPAWCNVSFNAAYGAFHSLLDTLYEMVIDHHMPDAYDDGPGYDDYEPTIYHQDTRTEHDV